MVCTGFIQPLDLECWLINTFSGSIPIFAGISLIIISVLSAKFKLPNIIFLAMMGLFVVLMQPYMQGIYLIVVTITGLLSFYSVNKLSKE